MNSINNDNNGNNDLADISLQTTFGERMACGDTIVVKDTAKNTFAEAGSILDELRSQALVESAPLGQSTTHVDSTPFGQSTTHVDSTPFGQSTTHVDSTPFAQLTTDVNSLTYNMKHENRGKCFIFNNKSFDTLGPSKDRSGTEADAEALYDCFQSLNFNVLTYNDISAKEIIDVLEAASKENHSQNDCIVICILTHGKLGKLWARDKKYKLGKVLSIFKGDQCPTLAGKPKIFFIQACQGKQLDEGVAIHRALSVTDSEDNFYRIPIYADFVIAHSTMPGFSSWRNPSKGSCFIQALTQVLGEHSAKKDLLTMMTIVSRTVAYDFESNVSNDPEMDKKKQIPCVTSMLTRLIYFTSKV